MLDPRSRDVELCSFYVTPEKETGDNPPQALAGQGTDDSSVTLAALVGWGLGSPRTPEILAVLQTPLHAPPWKPVCEQSRCPHTQTPALPTTGLERPETPVSHGRGKDGGPQLGTQPRGSRAREGTV